MSLDSVRPRTFPRPTLTPPTVPQEHRSAPRQNNSRVQVVSVPPRPAYPREDNNDNNPRTRASPAIRPGYTRDGKRIHAADSRRAVVEDDNGGLSVRTATEAGGSAVLAAAMALDSVARIETEGWKELKANKGNLGRTRLDWAAVGGWDPMSQRLPEIIGCYVYEEDGQEVKKIGSRSNIKIVEGARVGDTLIAESLSETARDPEEAVEELFGVTHEQRVEHWERFPRQPGRRR